MESTGAPIHPSTSTKDVVLTATHQVSVGEGDRSEGDRSERTRGRTLGDFRQSSSVRADLVLKARRRRHCPRKSHKVQLEIGRAQAGSDLVLWREGHRTRCFHMKDVYRVEQKKTKGKRDGRLHVTLKAKSGYYRYRLDFADEAECARAADAMLEHRTYKAPAEIKLRVCTWNMGNALPQARALRHAHCTRTAHALHMHCTCTAPPRRLISRRGWAETPTCLPWAYRRRATLQRELPCYTPLPCYTLHALTMLHARRPYHAAR
jgi:hypothetical protein